MQYVYGGFLSQIGTLRGNYPWQCSVDTQWVHVVLLFGWKVCISPLFVTGVKISHSTTLLKIELAFYRLKPYGELLELISHSWMLKNAVPPPQCILEQNVSFLRLDVTLPFICWRIYFRAFKPRTVQKFNPFRIKTLQGGWLIWCLCKMCRWALSSS